MIKFRDTKKQWEEIAPKLYKVLTTYTKDENLVKHVESLINKAEPKLIANMDLSSDVLPLYEVLSSDFYYQNRKDIKQDEETFLRELSNNLELLYKFAMKEENLKDVPEEAVEIKRNPNINVDQDIYDKDPSFRERII